MLLPLSVFIAGAVLVWALCFPVWLHLQRRNLVDRPNDRSSHTVPTVRGGGIAIMIVVLAGLVVLGALQQQLLPLIIAGGALILAVISFVDDLKPLPAGFRFAVHACVAVAFISMTGPGKLGLSLDLTAFQFAFATVLLFWIVGYTNAFNFMDGINGIAAGQTVATGIGTALLAGVALKSWNHPIVLASLLVAGAGLGFVPHNFPRARMFMGDVGSAPLGFLLAVLGVVTAFESTLGMLIPIFLLHANYILDTAITLVRRIVRGERFYEAHKEHFYQRLIRSGKSHTFVTLSEFGLQVVVLSLALLFLQVSAPARALIICTVVAIWGGYFLYAEKVFQSSLRQSLGGRPVDTASIA